ncbi:Mu-like prophage major head subunit gpT [Klebsiella pneumoniae]|uniref:Mu-like prophage major head subunit gpT n=1 Tax=Klebsiella pneumoniae TaxID=573 RepID=A0A2X3DFR3_KLEPN|nr:Mu-like prophage major head subunit gpT [Klebsiella pneumoniae]
MPQPSAEILHALSTSLSAAFTKGLSGVKPQYLRIATEVPSGSASNTYGWLSDLPGIKEWVGDRQLALLSQQGYTIPNKTWENSIRVKRENIEDDQIGQYSVDRAGVWPADRRVPGYAQLPAAGCRVHHSVLRRSELLLIPDHPMAGGIYSNIGG